MFVTLHCRVAARPVQRICGETGAHGLRRGLSPALRPRAPRANPTSGSGRWAWSRCSRCFAGPSPWSRHEHSGALDLQAAVADLESASDIAVALAPDGWHYVAPDLDERPWRRFYVQLVNDHRVAHLHLMVAGSPRWGEQQASRDALRADPALAQRYGALKQALAALHTGDREAWPTPRGSRTSSALCSQQRQGSACGDADGFLGVSPREE